MLQDNTPVLISEIRKVLHTHHISAGEITLYSENGNTATFFVDGKYLLKVSPSTLDEQVKLGRVRSLRLVPKIHITGSFTLFEREYHYVLMDYIQGDELWSAAQRLSNKEKQGIGQEIAQFLSELHSITHDSYDIGHYIPTLPQYHASWREGHIAYAHILQSGFSGIDLTLNSRQVISKAFDYLSSHIDALQYQAGAKLLHNDFHPKNIIVREGKLAGVIDWECSQYGEADFELTHLFHWCIYPTIPENKLDLLLKAVVENLPMTAMMPDMEKRFTIYQLEHELNQIIWNGKKQEEERIYRINGWLGGKVSAFLKLIDNA